MNTEHTGKSWKMILECAELIRELGDSDMLKEAARITYAQGRVMRMLFRHGDDGVMLKDIAGELHQTKGAASQTVDALARQGYVERRPDEDDRRALSIILTGRGRVIQERHTRSYSQLLEPMLAKIPRHEQEIFLKVLSSLLVSLKNMNTK